MSEVPLVVPHSAARYDLFYRGKSVTRNRLANSPTVGSCPTVGSWKRHFFASEVSLQGSGFRV